MGTVCISFFCINDFGLFVKTFANQDVLCSQAHKHKVGTLVGKHTAFWGPEDYLIPRISSRNSIHFITEEGWEVFTVTSRASREINSQLALLV